MRLQVLIAFQCAAGVLAACGPSSPSSPGESGREVSATELASAASTSRVPRARPRQQDGMLRQLRAHLDRGEIELARPLLSIVAQAGDEGPELAARALALEGRNIEALRRLEEARRKNPSDPAGYAAAAEIYAAAGSPDTAWSEIQRGEEACGPCADLVRAKGILWIGKEGGARKGLALLESALAADPEIPFIERALGQAHLLVAKDCARNKDAAGALTQVKKSLEFDPKDVDARRFLGDLLAASGDFEGALASLSALIAQGQPLEGELALMYKKAGIAALLAHRRDEALRDFREARRHGLTDEELSSGARLLAEEAGLRTEAGVQAYAAGDLATAETCFRAALELEPQHLQAQNHLAVVLFKTQDYAGAIALWRAVLDTARNEKIALPEPVHLNLAKAQMARGDTQGARITLEEYLDREPFGVWLQATREMLDLTPEAPAPR